MNQNQLEAWTHARFTEEIDLMKQAISAYTRKIEKPHVVKKLVDECRARIFNAATYLGDFHTAYEYAPTAEDARFVVRLARALSRGESETCKCPIEHIQTLGSPVEIPRFFNWRKIYDKDRGVWVDIYKCSHPNCNFLTAHPNATATQSARNLERVRNRKYGRQVPKDDEALRQ